jgi:hypothetical protein
VAESNLNNTIEQALGKKKKKKKVRRDEIKTAVERIKNFLNWHPRSDCSHSFNYSNPRKFFKNIVVAGNIL